MSVTVAQVVTHFLERSDLALGTLKSYEYTLSPFLSEYGYWKVEFLSRQVLKDYLDSLSHLAYTTHRKHQSILIALMNFAVDEGYIEVNPIHRLKFRKPNLEFGEHRSDEVIRYFTPQQLELMYQKIELSGNWRLYTLIKLLHQTGARIGEVLALNLSNIDEEQCRFQVVGKGNKKRWCFYNQDLANILKEYIQFYRFPNPSALFTAQHPTSLKISRLSYATAYEDWVNIVSSVPELKDAKIHNLRHTFATERVGLMGIEELRALMGHESIQTTLRYQKVTSSRAGSVAKKALQTLSES